MLNTWDSRPQNVWLNTLLLCFHANIPMQHMFTSLLRHFFFIHSFKAWWMHSFSHTMQIYHWRALSPSPVVLSIGWSSTASHKWALFLSCLSKLRHVFNNFLCRYWRNFWLNSCMLRRWHQPITCMYHHNHLYIEHKQSTWSKSTCLCLNYLSSPFYTVLYIMYVVCKLFVTMWFNKIKGRHFPRFYKLQCAHMHAASLNYVGQSSLFIIYVY